MSYEFTAGSARQQQYYARTWLIVDRLILCADIGVTAGFDVFVGIEWRAMVLEAVLPVWLFRCMIS